MQRNFTAYLFLILLTIIFVHNTNGQQQIENPGFEYWEDFGIGPDTLEPVNWSSLKSSDGGELINMLIPQVWEQSTDAHSGMYSVRLENLPILAFVAPGTLTNGRVHATFPPSDAFVFSDVNDPQWNTSFTDTPDSLAIWVKFFPQLDDKAHVIAILHTDSAKIVDSTAMNWIATAHIEIPNEINEWTRLSVPFTYLNSNIPEHILFAIYSGDAQNAQLGSIMYLDDIELTYYNVSVNSASSDLTKIYFANDKLFIKLSTEDIHKNLTYEILDLSGRVILSSEFLSSTLNEFDANIPAGVYICKIKNESMEFTQKLVK